jgi:hypothetical protein
MSERETDNSTGGNNSGDRETDQAGGRGQPDRDKDEFEAGTGYQPSTNQAQDEPLPASHHDDGGQETARRRDEPVRDPSPDGQHHEDE